MAKDHRIIEKHGGNAYSVLTRAPQWWQLLQPSDCAVVIFDESDEEVGLEVWISLQKRSLTGGKYHILKFPGLESVVLRFHAVHERVRASDEPCRFEDAKAIVADMLKEEYARQLAAGVVPDVPDKAPSSRC